MELCFENNYLLNEISLFLRYNEIISFSMCNKALYKLLSNYDDKNDKNSKNNIIINNINNHNKNDENNSDNNNNNNKHNYNSTINLIFLFSIIDEYFELDITDYKNENKKNLLGKNIDFEVDWKLFLKHFRFQFAQCKDQEIRKRVHDFFKIHIYLPDLRKECFHLEFEKSSIHELFSYDINSRLIHTYHYYSKYINFENLILHPENKCKVKILREKLKFEESLIKFKDLFCDFVNNKEIADLVNNIIIKYKYKDLFDIYNKTNLYNKYVNICKNKQFSEILSFILWVNNIFISYCEFNFQFIKGLNNNLDDEELLLEFISKKNDLINCALLINSTYENVNIIINFLSIFYNIYKEYNKGEQKSLSSGSTDDSDSNLKDNNQIYTNKYNNKIISTDKFTLYNLFLKSIEEFYTSKLLMINKSFQKEARSYFEEIFTVNQEDNQNKKKKEDKMDEEDSDDSMINEIKLDDEDEDMSMDFDLKPTKKEIIENFMNSMVERTINGQNANGIMHTGFIVQDWYVNDYEDVLVSIFKEQILKAINNDMSLDQCYEIVEKTTMCDGNSKNLRQNKDSLVLIRRTKKKLMKVGFCTIFQELIEELSNDFNKRITEDKKLYLSNIEKLKSQDYKCNLDALSEEGEKIVENRVEEEYKKAIEFLLKNNNLNDSDKKLAEEYIYSNKIPYPILFKKLVWNFYKQIEIYEERNSTVKYYLTHYNEKYGDKNQCYKIEKKESKNNKDCNKDELFNNCRTNFWHQEEVPVDSQKII